MYYWGEIMMNKSSALIATALLSAGLFACSDTEEGSAEKMGKQIDQAMEEARARSEETKKELAETMEQTEKDLQEAMDHAKEVTGEEMQELGESLQESGEEMQK
jgi:phosphopentomutase